MHAIPPIRKLWILSPCYFDVACFLKLRSSILQNLEPLSIEAPNFVVVDDSTGLDPTTRQLAHLSDVRLLSTPVNLGAVRSIVYGLRAISPEVHEDDLVMSLDCDGEDRPEDVPRLLANLLENPNELRRVVLARRTKRHETPFFKVLYFFFKIFFKLLTGDIVRHGSFAAFRGWLVVSLIEHPYFDLCYSTAFLGLNLKLEFVPCERGERYAGKSSMNYLKLVHHGLKMLMPLMDRITIRAILGSLIGLMGSLGILLAHFGLRLFHWQAGPTWLPWACFAVFFISAFSFTCFLMLFSSFTQEHSRSIRSYDKSRQRPELRNSV